jgi:hypothetical protein
VRYPHNAPPHNAPLDRKSPSVDNTSRINAGRASAGSYGAHMPKRKSTQRKAPRSQRRARPRVRTPTPSAEERHRLVIEAVAEGIYE